MRIVQLIIKFDLRNELCFSNFDILESLGVTMYSGGCKNATKEGCNTKEFPLIYSTGIECLCKSDLCNSSYRFIGSYLFISFIVISVLLFNKWSIAIIKSKSIYLKFERFIQSDKWHQIIFKKILSLGLCLLYKM